MLLGILFCRSLSKSTSTLLRVSVRVRAMSGWRESTVLSDRRMTKDEHFLRDPTKQAPPQFPPYRYEVNADHPDPFMVPHPLHRLLPPLPGIEQHHLSVIGPRGHHPPAQRAAGAVLGRAQSGDSCVTIEAQLGYLRGAVRSGRGRWHGMAWNGMAWG